MFKRISFKPLTFNTLASFSNSCIFSEPLPRIFPSKSINKCHISFIARFQVTYFLSCVQNKTLFKYHPSLLFASKDVCNMTNCFPWFLHLSLISISVLQCSWFFDKFLNIGLQLKTRWSNMTFHSIKMTSEDEVCYLRLGLWSCHMVL